MRNACMIGFNNVFLHRERVERPSNVNEHV